MIKKLIINGSLPNLNDYTKACRANRFVGAKLKKEAEELISWYIHMHLPDVHFTKTVNIDFTWYEANKKRDLDNVCFAKKFILDALVSNEVIASDGWKGVRGFMDHFEVDADKPRIEVVISDEEVNK